MLRIARGLSRCSHCAWLKTRRTGCDPRGPHQKRKLRVARPGGLAGLISLQWWFDSTTRKRRRRRGQFCGAFKWTRSRLARFANVTEGRHITAAWSNGRAPVLQTGDEGSIPSAATRARLGPRPLDQREIATMTGWRRRFDSFSGHHRCATDVIAMLRIAGGSAPSYPRERCCRLLNRYE